MTEIQKVPLISFYRIIYADFDFVSYHTEHCPELSTALWIWWYSRCLQWGQSAALSAASESREYINGRSNAIIFIVISSSIIATISVYVTATATTAHAFIGCRFPWISLTDNPPPTHPRTQPQLPALQQLLPRIPPVNLCPPPWHHCSQDSGELLGHKCVILHVFHNTFSLLEQHTLHHRLDKLQWSHFSSSSLMQIKSASEPLWGTSFNR